MMPEVIEELKRVLRKAGLAEGDITEALASISIMQEVTPIRDGEQYRAYEERYSKMMQDAGFVGQKRSWEEYMDYARTPAGRLALALFNRMVEWKAAKGVP
jgi:hypothetical protein